jgi:hypothetical protein
MCVRSLLHTILMHDLACQPLPLSIQFYGISHVRVHVQLPIVLAHQ